MIKKEIETKIYEILKCKIGKEEMHIRIRNYQHILSLEGINVSYREAKNRIHNHIDRKKFDRTYYVLETILHHKLKNVNYALGY